MRGEAYFVAHETHSAVVLLVGDRAVKFKKPVNLGFLDFTTLEQRRLACHREVELNRRIAPDVYTGVDELVAADGQTREYLVSMRRMPADRRLSTLVSSGAPVESDVRRIARQVASFHAAARRGPAIAAQGSRDAIRRRWTDTFRQLRALPQLALPADVLDEVETLALEFLDGRAELFGARVAAGRIVDGHGDLLADDIYCLPDGPRILDCIEFDDALRFLDQLDDAAFLGMDLEYLGAADLAQRYLAWYAEFAADPAPASLRHHFVAYRAFVRAKVACFRYSQGDAEAADTAIRHADLALRHLRAGVVSLVLVGGPPGTGKSTISGALADTLGAVVVSTDRVRKELAGVNPDQSAAAEYGAGIYTPQWTQRAYDEVLHRSGELLRLGETVIVDASWSSAAARARARHDARANHSRLLELCCHAPSDIALARIRSRPHPISDADATVHQALAAAADPWPEAITIDTTGPVSDTIGLAADAVRGAHQLVVS
jgi:aminoglycoside phosphotransferase family enzyme/predicted kinase